MCSEVRFDSLLSIEGFKTAVTFTSWRPRTKWAASASVTCWKCRLTSLTPDLLNHPPGDSNARWLLRTTALDSWSWMKTTSPEPDSLSVCHCLIMYSESLLAKNGGGCLASASLRRYFWLRDHWGFQKARHLGFCHCISQTVFSGAIISCKMAVGVLWISKISFWNTALSTLRSQSPGETEHRPIGMAVVQWDGKASVSGIGSPGSTC